MFEDTDGSPWRPSNQHRPMREAWHHAEIEPPVSIHPPPQVRESPHKSGRPAASCGFRPRPSRRAHDRKTLRASRPVSCRSADSGQLAPTRWSQAQKDPEGQAAARLGHLYLNGYRFRIIIPNYGGVIGAAPAVLRDSHAQSPRFERYHLILQMDPRLPFRRPLRTCLA